MVVAGPKPTPPAPITTAQGSALSSAATVISLSKERMANGAVTPVVPASYIDLNEAVHYLFTLGRELASPRQASATKFDLENITALCERLGIRNAR